ncbi:MAG: glycosyltransferase family 39 protein [Candidatus Omnitrophica bacterium]|nr:glycosyltransferase family 39 protein [Candidatus Omnitrophota bacterium]
MNYWQLITFIIYIISIYAVGTAVYLYINEKPHYLNRSIYIGESFLLGSIVVIGGMLTLSLLGLYKAPFIWGIALSGYALLLKKNIREKMMCSLFKGISFDIPFFVFWGLIIFFILRNYYPLVTGDSHNIYLFTQRLWLEEGTSLVGNEGFNIGIFTPQFNAVPYALGISIFGQETLFSQLINVSWRLIVLLLVFGYTNYRFNKYFGLMAMILVYFDEHFFFSGANACVVINGAVVAFLFAAVYNFWEARERNDSLRFLLAVIFSIYLMANKYQMAYVMVGILLMGIFIQRNKRKKIKEILLNKKYLIFLILSVFFLSLWFFKNYLITGCPTFPALADKFHAFNWTGEMVDNFSKVFGGVSADQFIKYFNYFFIWPGIGVSKILILVFSLFPIILFVAASHSNIEKEVIKELGFWLTVSFLSIAGICFIAYTDPRPYRYIIGVLSFSTIISIDFILKYTLLLKERILYGWVSVILLVIFLVPSIVLKKGLPCTRPTLEENVDVLLNKTHMKDVIQKYYHNTANILEEYNKNKNKANQSAWDIGYGGRNSFSAFLLPIRPQVGLWCTTIINWDSYKDKNLVVRDLNKYGIKWIMNGEEGYLKFVSLSEYADQVVLQNRYPKNKFYNYNFPEELSKSGY